MEQGGSRVDPHCTSPWRVTRPPLFRVHRCCVPTTCDDPLTLEAPYGQSSDVVEHDLQTHTGGKIEREREDLLELIVKAPGRSPSTELGATSVRVCALAIDGPPWLS
jgi:hypothetical protein